MIQIPLTCKQAHWTLGLSLAFITLTSLFFGIVLDNKILIIISVLIGLFGLFILGLLSVFWLVDNIKCKCDK